MKKAPASPTTTPRWKDWRAWFEHNSANRRTIPWSCGLIFDQLAAVVLPFPYSRAPEVRPATAGGRAS